MKKTIIICDKCKNEIDIINNHIVEIAGNHFDTCTSCLEDFRTFQLAFFGQNNITIPEIETVTETAPETVTDPASEPIIEIAPIPVPKSDLNQTDLGRPTRKTKAELLKHRKVATELFEQGEEAISVAEKTGVPYKTIWKWKDEWKKSGGKVNQSAPVETDKASDGLKTAVLGKDLLYDLYIVKNLNMHQIAVKLGKNVTEIHEACAKFGIVKDKTAYKSYTGYVNQI